MNTNKPYSESDLLFLAKSARIKSGATKTQAARKMKVAVSSVYDAEENPRRSMFPLRKRMIEIYTGFKLVGPEFRLRRK